MVDLDRHLARYRSKIIQGGADDCWGWTGAPDPKGYGRFKVREKSHLAHRWGYANTVGPICGGLSVCHRCDNPPCQNPRHWFLGTNHDNVLDRHAKGRTVMPRFRGEASPAAKLSDAQAADVISRYREGGVSQRVLALEYGINQATVSLIVNGRRRRG